jgi:hypothetical protein
MHRTWIAGLLVLFAAADVHAEVIKGEVKKVDADKGILVVSVKGKEHEFRLAAGTKISIQVAAGVVEPEDGLKNEWFKRAQQAAGTGQYPVEVTVEKKEGKDVVTKVYLFTPTREDD